MCLISSPAEAQVQENSDAHKTVVNRAKRNLWASQHHRSFEPQPDVPLSNPDATLEAD